MPERARAVTVAPARPYYTARRMAITAVPSDDSERQLSSSRRGKPLYVLASRPVNPSSALRLRKDAARGRRGRRIYR